MEVDMAAPTDTLQVHATKTRAKRARSPASPRTSERPRKRPSLGASVCLSVPAPAPAARSRHGSEDWVVQTRELHIDSTLGEQGARLAGVEEVAAAPGAEGCSSQMADVTMYDEDIPMACSPPRPRLGIDAHSEPIMPPSHSTLQSQGRPSTFTTPPDVRMTASQPHQPALRKQKFTMGPRADCEKCRLGVKGHWMHFD